MLDANLFIQKLLIVMIHLLKEASCIAPSANSRTFTQMDCWWFQSRKSQVCSPQVLQYLDFATRAMRTKPCPHLSYSVHISIMLLLWEQRELSRPRQYEKQSMHSPRAFIATCRIMITHCAVHVAGHTGHHQPQGHTTCLWQWCLPSRCTEWLLCLIWSTERHSGEEGHPTFQRLGAFSQHSWHE